MVVRKGEKRERLEKRQLYHQRVSSSFHPQNHTERARSPSYSLLFSRSLLFSFALSLPLSPLPLFLFSLSLSLSLLSRSLFLSLSSLSLSLSLPLPLSPLLHVPLARVLSFRLARLDGSQHPGQGLGWRFCVHGGHSLIPPGRQPLVRMSCCRYWPCSSSSRTAVMRRAGSSGRSTTTSTSATCLVLGGAPL